MRFCPSCGARLRPTRTGRPVCTACGGSTGDSGGGIRKRTAIDHFPFESMRPFQREVLEKLDASLSSHKFVILEAPVGFGKSAVAASLCNYLGSAFILTSTKQLQDQYRSDFGYSIITGKSNFTCCVPTTTGRHVPCSKGRCEVDWKLSECTHYLNFKEFEEHQKGLCTKKSKCENLKGRKLCPYYDQKWSGFRTGVTVCNYPFFLSELRYTDELPLRKLLVCDEVHELEKQIVSFTSFAIKRSVYQQYLPGAEVQSLDGLSIPDRGEDDPAAWLEVITDLKGLLQDFDALYLDDGSMQDRMATCRNTLQSLEDFMGRLKREPSNWVVNSVRRLNGNVEEVVFQPLSIGEFTAPLFDSAEHIILMSATVSSKEMLCKSLGIPEESACFVKVAGSSFPVDNRPIYQLNVARLNKASMEQSLESVARAIDQIMTTHVTERGIVHCTSYQQVNYIIQHVSDANRSRLVTTEGSSDRAALLQMHGSTDASVLISPSLYLGVDLKDDLSRFQVIVKVPFPDLSERRTRVKLERDKRWYDWQTALRLLQTYGRSVRSSTDHAVTYILDSNCGYFLETRRDLFPEYFLEAVRQI